MFAIASKSESVRRKILPDFATHFLTDKEVLYEDWVRQLLDQGKLDRKRVCRTFSYCTALMRSKDHPLGQYPTGCPPFDKDAYGEVWKEVQQLQVKK